MFMAHVELDRTASPSSKNQVMVKHTPCLPCCSAKTWHWGHAPHKDWLVTGRMSLEFSDSERPLTKQSSAATCPRQSKSCHAKNVYAHLSTSSNLPHLSTFMFALFALFALCNGPEGSKLMERKLRRRLVAQHASASATWQLRDRGKTFKSPHSRNCRNATKSSFIEK